MQGTKIVLYSLVAGLFLSFIGCTKDKVGFGGTPNCTDTISFNQEVLPIIQAHCSGCHGSGNGTGYTLEDYSSVSTNASAVLGSMKGNGYQLMPIGGPGLPDSVIQKVECWMLQGKKNN